MASRGSRSAIDPDERDVLTPSLTSLLRPIPKTKYPNLRYTIHDILPLDDATFPDRRAYAPDKSIKPPASITRGATRIRAGYHPRSLHFQTPNLIALCLKRKMRKEVLHALRKTGKGGNKKRKLNFWSRIGC